MHTLNVCVGSACHIKGSYNIIQTFLQLLEEEGLHEQAEVKMQFCMKQCQKEMAADIDEKAASKDDVLRFSASHNSRGVAVAVGEDYYSVSPEMARTFFQSIVLPKIRA